MLPMHPEKNALFGVYCEPMPSMDCRQERQSLLSKKWNSWTWLICDLNKQVSHVTQDTKSMAQLFVLRLGSIDQFAAFKKISFNLIPDECVT